MAVNYYTCQILVDWSLLHTGDQVWAWAIEIPADLQPFVHEQLQLGFFNNEEQFITEALRLLRAAHEESLERIQKGLADVAASRVQPLADAFADIRREPNLSDPA